MKTKDEVIAQIREAFAPNVYPGDWCIKGSTEGDEPYLLEQEFKADGPKVTKFGLKR